MRETEKETKLIGCEIQELYEVIIYALEKQIPKKVVQPFGKGEGCYCPCCGAGVDKDYCGNCGQKLDWK